MIGDAGIGKSRLLYEFENWLELLPEKVYFFAGSVVREPHPVAVRVDAQRLTTRFDILDSDDAATVQAKLRAGFADVARRRATPTSSAHWIGLDIGDGDGRPPARRLGRPPDRGPVAPRRLVPRTSPPTRPVAHAARGPALGRRRVPRPARAPRRAARRRAAARGRRRPPELLDRRELAPSDVMIRLDVLPPDATTALVREVLQHVVDVPDVLVERRSPARADGNAFFVEELVSMLIDEGVIVTDDPATAGGSTSTASTPIAIPATLTAVLLARLDGLRRAGAACAAARRGRRPGLLGRGGRRARTRPTTCSTRSRRPASATSCFSREPSSFRDHDRVRVQARPAPRRDLRDGVAPRPRTAAPRRRPVDRDGRRRPRRRVPRARRRPLSPRRRTGARLRPSCSRPGWPGATRRTSAPPGAP